MKRRHVTRVLALIALAVSLASLSGKDQPPISGHEIAQRIFPSVVLIVSQDSHAQPLSLGSGFMVADEIVATNLHVIEGATGGFVRLVGEPNKYAIRGTVGVDQQHDLALLSISGLHASALSLADSEKPSAGDEIYAIGNPEGLEGTISQGIVSGVREIDSGTLLQITAPISPGSSGGPVVNIRGEVIGLAVATLKVGQNLNFAVPSQYLSDLLRHRTEIRALPQKQAVDPDWSRGTGDPLLTGVAASGFLWTYAPDPASRSTFSFTLRNDTQSPVGEVRYVIIFYDNEGNQIHAYGPKTTWAGIRPGLAKREVVLDQYYPMIRETIGKGKHKSTYTHYDSFAYPDGVDASVQMLTRRFEIRVLDFTLAEEGDWRWRR